MKKLLVGVLLSLSLVGCGEVDVKEVREAIQDQNLPKKERREAINEYLEEKVDKNEDMLFDSIINCDYIDACMKTKQFADKFVPNVGNASKFIVDKIIEKCEL